MIKIKDNYVERIINNNTLLINKYEPSEIILFTGLTQIMYNLLMGYQIANINLKENDIEDFIIELGDLNILEDSNE